MNKNLRIQYKKVKHKGDCLGAIGVINVIISLGIFAVSLNENNPSLAILSLIVLSNSLTTAKYNWEVKDAVWKDLDDDGEYRVVGVKKRGK